MTLPRIEARSLDGRNETLPPEDGLLVGCFGLASLLEVNGWRLLLETEFNFRCQALVFSDSKLEQLEVLFPPSRHFDTFHAKEEESWRSALSRETFACWFAKGLAVAVAVGPPVESRLEPFVLAVQARLNPKRP